MAPINKVQFSKESGFDLRRAMELANLIEVAYDEYAVWDYRQTKLSTQPKKLPPTSFICSTEFVELAQTPVNPLEAMDSRDMQVIKPKESYGELDQFWQERTVKQYKRVENFWATEWWFLTLLDVPFLAKSFQQNLKESFQEIRNADSLTDLLQLAGQLPRNLLDNTANLVRDDQLFGFVAKSQTNPDEIFVVLRGTREQAEWFNNFRPRPKKFLEEQKEKFDDLGEVRNGFNRIYSEKREGSKNPTIEQTIIKLFENQQDFLKDGSKIFIAGHSLGSGLATLAALHISKIAQLKGVKTSINLYTFASPRVGDEIFAKNINTLEALDCYHIINSEDLIQSVPLPTTQVVDESILNSMNAVRKARTLWLRGFLETITNGQAGKHYQHIGIPIGFTTQTGTIAGNHNLTKTYREALRE